MNVIEKFRLMLLAILTLVATSTYAQGIALSDDSRLVSSGAGDHFLEVLSCDVSWTAEIVYPEDSPSGWLSLTGTASGDATTTYPVIVPFHCDANESVEDRTAYINFVNEDGSVINKFTLTQRRFSPSLQVDTSTLTFSSDGGSNKFFIMSNVEWKIEINYMDDSNNWIVLSSNTGSNDEEINVEVLPNRAQSKREAILVISSVNNSYNQRWEVQISQLGSRFSLEVSPVSLTFQKEAATQSIEIAGNVAWTASSSDSEWLTLDKTSGTNNGTIMASVTTYDGIEPRTATITVSGESMVRTVSVTQLGDKLSLDVSPTSLTFQNTAATQAIEIAGNVAWTASSSDSEWLTLDKTSGTNNGTIMASVTAYDGTEPRTATITVSGESMVRTVSVTQLGDRLSLDVSPTSLTFQNTAGTQNIEVAGNVAWIARSDSEWLTLDKTSGTNNGTIMVSVTAYDGMESRKATITVEGNGMEKIVNVTQLGDKLTLNVSPTSLTFQKDVSTQSVEVAGNVIWTASSNAPDWLTLDKTIGENNGTIKVTVAAYEGTEPRTAIVSVEGAGMKREISVTQLGNKSALNVSPMSLTFQKDGGTQSFDVAGNVTWTTESSDSWLTLSPKSGFGNGKISVTAERYNGTQPRTAKVVVMGDGIDSPLEISVTQLGDLLALSISPTSLTFQNTAGTQNIEVAGNVTWTASSSDSAWLTLDVTSGTNNGTIMASVTAYDGIEPRTATITVSGESMVRTVSVTQLGDKLSLNVSPTSLTFQNTAATQAIEIAGNVAWTASSSDSEWLTLDKTSGTNNGTIMASVTAYDGTEPRIATITVSGEGMVRTVSVTQLGDKLSLNVSPTRLTYQKNAATQSIEVAGNVTWTASSSDSAWLTLDVTSGTNNGTIMASVTAYDGTEPRTATITVSGESMVRTVSVTQLGDKLSLNVSPTSLTFQNTAGTQNIEVAGNVAWTASSSESEWLILDKTSGTNNGTIVASVTAYDGTEPRTAIITVSGESMVRAVSVTQLGDKLSLNVSPTSLTFQKEGGDLDINIAGNVDWIVDASEEWLVLSKYKGVDNDKIIVTANPYTGQDPRYAKIKVNGEGLTNTIEVTQLGNLPQLSVSPESYELQSEGGNFEINVSGNVEWTAESSDTSWLTMDITNGLNNGVINVTVSKNENNDERIATITVAGQGLDDVRVVRVTQKGTGYEEFDVVCANTTIDNGDVSTTIKVKSDVDWEASVDVDWIVLELEGNEASGNKIYGSKGESTVNISAKSNGDIYARQAHITFISKNNDKREIIILQKGQAYLNITSSANGSPNYTFNVGPGEKNEYIIKSNVPWNITFEDSVYFESDIDKITPEVGTETETKIVIKTKEYNNQKNQINKNLYFHHITPQTLKGDIGVTVVILTQNGLPTLPNTNEKDMTVRIRLKDNTPDSVAVESTIGEKKAIIATVNGKGFIEIDPINNENKEWLSSKWKLTWTCDEESYVSADAICVPDSNVLKTITVTAEYRGAPERLKYTGKIDLYPAPMYPSKIVQKGNGTSRIMIATFEGKDSTKYANNKNYWYVFGYTDGNDTGNFESVNERYYQYPQTKFNDGITKWVCTTWTVNGTDIPSLMAASTQGLIDTPSVVPGSKGLGINNVVAAGDVKMEGGRMVANMDTAVSAEIQVYSITGVMIRSVAFEPSYSFDEPLPLEDLAAGMYIVNCRVGNEYVQLKVSIR